MRRISLGDGRRPAALIGSALLAFPVGAIVGHHLLGAPSSASAEQTATTTAEQAPRTIGRDGLRRMTNEDVALTESVEGYTLPPEWAACAPSVPEGYVEVGVSLDLTAGCGATAAQSDDHVNEIGTVAPPQVLTQRCRADDAAEPSCGVVLAMADGNLAPGRYTDEELQAAVEAAGYQWKPAR